MTASEIVDKYITFFAKREHKRIPNASLVPENDPTTLFTSSGMQPLVPYLLGETHPLGTRLVNAQNCFRAQDIEEIGDNRHTTFFRMLGNWSLGDYFKKEQLPWFFEFLTQELELDPKRLYVSIFRGYKEIPKDEESEAIWTEVFEQKDIDPKKRIFFYGTDENWWSRAGEPENMPPGEPGGPDSEVFFDFFPDQEPIENDLKKYSHSGRLLEIGNTVFMQYKKTQDGFDELPHKNVDFGGGLERLLAANEDKQDMFQTDLFSSIIRTIEQSTKKQYQKFQKEMRIVTDHFIASTFIISSNVTPSNKERGYILRRLLRRGMDNFSKLEGKDITPIIESIVDQYKDTNEHLAEQFELIKNIILEEEQKYKKTLHEAKTFIVKKYKQSGDELKGVKEISPEDMFALYTTHGLSPAQIESLGFVFDKQAFAQKMEEHQNLSRAGATQKFRGGLADHHEKTVMGHTATHLLHQALRDVLGNHVHQTGSNITTGRVRFDFNYDKRLTDEEIKQVENIINKKIKENLPISFEILSKKEADVLGAIGLFQDAYGDKVKIYFIGDTSTRTSASGARSARPYSVEFCGGPHVDFTGTLKSVKIIKQENLGKGQRRIYAIVNG